MRWLDGIRMNLVQELFFPTPIYYLDLEGAESLNQYLLPRIYAWRDRDQSGIARSNVRTMGAWHSHTNMNKLPEFELFVRKIEQTMVELFTAQNYHPNSKPASHNMWANINPPGGYNRSHTHPGSLWSGVYYVQAPEHCGRVVFHDPRVQAEVQPIKIAEDKLADQRHWREVNHKAMAGRLVLFPSWLRHEVEPNLAKVDEPYSDRISISFNYGQM